MQKEILWTRQWSAAGQEKKGKSLSERNNIIVRRSESIVPVLAPDQLEKVFETENDDDKDQNSLI
jgi:hypothetical protein